MGLFGRIRSEVAYLKGALSALREVTPIAENKSRTLPDRVEEWAERFGDRPALISERETFSYRQLNGRANRYARWAIANGVKKGDCVALMMPNRPEYLVIWLGIARAGGVTALVNTNLTGASLAHCINIVEPKHIIVAGELWEAFETAAAGLGDGAQVWLHGEGGRANRRLDEEIEDYPDAAIPAAERPALNTDDRCLFIYTSGTTGLPKAANINHYRVQAIMAAFATATEAGKNDRHYSCLPMYHTVGGVIATGIALWVGGSVFIRERFSARSFWDDVVDNGCTSFQYIGELCRYLLNSPTHPKERAHRLRIVNGNGLRPDIWNAFTTRFAIPRIREWSAATEGNCVMFNFAGRPGSIGRIPKWAEKRFITAVVKFDYQSEQPMRGPDGFCIRCAPNEVGGVISKILNDPKRPGQRFEGYADPKAAASKILNDVFEKADRGFRTGDLMRRDERGYFFFIDRIGDTFRWKGENVATSEVSEAISVFPGVREANVYGVSVRGRDGRAGMAAIVADDSLDLEGLRRHAEAHLPDYARPIFLRIVPQSDMTGTFKMRKVDLVRQGFDPALIKDPLYYADPVTGRYAPLDARTYDRIQNGEIRV